MEYKIKPSTQFISKKEFIWRDLGLDSIDGDIYALTLSFGAFTGTYDDLRTKTGVKSLASIQKRINRMVDNGILARRKVQIAGTMIRVVLCAVYEESGKRSQEIIDSYLSQGEIAITNYYLDKCIIKTVKKKGKSKRYIEM